MNERQFYDWQTLGGGNDVDKLVSALGGLGVSWCMIGGLAVNHWAAEPLATADVDIVIGVEDVDRSVAALEKVGFKAKRFDWSVNLTGSSKVTVQISTDEMYREFPSTAVEAEVHGIRMKIATAENTLLGKIAAYSDSRRRVSKRQKDFLDIIRLVEANPALIEKLPSPLRLKVEETLQG